MTLIMAVKWEDRVIVVSDSRTKAGNAIVPPFHGKIAVIDDVLVGLAGELAYSQYYVDEMRAGKLAGENVINREFHRGMQAKLIHMGQVTQVDEKGEPQETCVGPMQMILAQGATLRVSSSDELPMDVPYATIGSGTAVANNYMYFLLQGNPVPLNTFNTSVGSLVHELAYIGQRVAATDVSISGPWFYADTVDLGIHRLPGYAEIRNENV